MEFCKQLGTAQQWIKEGKYALKWMRMSFHHLDTNQVRLQLFALAYNLANFVCRPALPRVMRHLSITTLRKNLNQPKIVRHAQYVTSQLTAIAIPHKLFQGIHRRLVRFRVASLTPEIG